MKLLKRLLGSEYGMIGVLLSLCLFFSLITYDEQQPVGLDAAQRVSEQIDQIKVLEKSVIIAGTGGKDGQIFAEHLEEILRSKDWYIKELVIGGPPELGQAINKAFEGNSTVSLLACEKVFVNLPVVENLKRKTMGIKSIEIVYPEAYNWPNFLKATNLLNVANQIAVIAIIAIGMTLVIITAGIDLSVGSLIAFSAVLATWVIQNWFGGVGAGLVGIITGCLIAILVCGGLGLFTGTMVAYFKVPPFVSSLGMMMVSSGFAYMLSGGLSIYQLPDAFSWLGRGDDLGGIPNAVVLMIILYLLAHFLMKGTTIGRYIYAVGGNSEAARLSGIPVKRILLWVYAGSAALAGLGGVVMASQFQSGDPKYGLMYELYVIAAVVVGGTSLAGGRGRVFGTLIGAFIIAVIQNGMNLTGVQSYTQKVVLGFVLLAAVLIDLLKKHGWRING